MSFALPSVKVKPEVGGNQVKHNNGPYEMQSPFLSGLGAIKPKAATHPLEVSERSFQLNEQKMNMAMLRNIQGLHAPMKLSMEMKYAKKVGRLPFLPSSNLQADVLSGRYIEIGFEDILNTPELCEIAGQPHAVVERSMGIL